MFGFGVGLTGAVRDWIGAGGGVYVVVGGAEGEGVPPVAGFGV
jgi:hypothetical protein